MGAGPKLRRLAEERLKKQEADPGGNQTQAETARLPHELQVHQIELEMQNEELATASARIENLLVQYTDLYEFAPAGYLSLDRGGVIRRVNLSGARLFGVPRSRLVNRRFLLMVDLVDRVVFSDFLQRLFSRSDRQSCEVLLLNGGADGPIVRIEATRSDHEEECRAVMLDVTERKRAESQLEASRELLRNLATRLRTVREEERTRIAREVHDQLGHAFTDLKFDLAWLKRRLQEDGAPSRSPMVRRISRMIKRVTDEIDLARRIAAELRPAVLDTLGLAAAVEWASMQFERRTQIGCDLELPEGDLALDQRQSTALFRIFQETLSNVSRHAGASRVRVRIRAGSGGLTLEVSDDGRGITGEEIASPHALGLLGMRERAIELGGEMAIRGSAGQGTSVIVTLPLRYPGRAP